MDALLPSEEYDAEEVKAYEDWKKHVLDEPRLHEYYRLYATRAQLAHTARWAGQVADAIPFPEYTKISCDAARGFEDGLYAMVEALKQAAGEGK